MLKQINIHLIYFNILLNISKHVFFIIFNTTDGFLISIKIIQRVIHISLKMPHFDIYIKIGYAVVYKSDVCNFLNSVYSYIVKKSYDVS